MPRPAARPRLANSNALGTQPQGDALDLPAIRADAEREREQRLAMLRARFAEIPSDAGARPSRPRRAQEL